MSHEQESKELYASESALLEAVESGLHLGDGEFLDSMMSAEEARTKANKFQQLIDWYLPKRYAKRTLDSRRRSRFVVIIGMLAIPFYGVLVQQLAAYNLVVPSIVAGSAAVLTLLAVMSMKIFRSHVIPGSFICLLMSLMVFYQAMSDWGFSDPILYWSALVPLAAALAVGSKLATVCAILNVGGVTTLYILAQTGYAFPEVTTRSELQFSSLLSISTAAIFALIWGWFYEGYTLKEIKGLSTRLNRFRAALARSEERYRSLFDNVPLGVYRSRPNGEILVVNRALIEMLGYKNADDIQNIHPDEEIYAYPEQRKHFQDRIEKDGGVDQFSTVWKRKDGVHIHVRENARAVFDSTGKAIYYEGTVEDVTAQRRVQQALRKSEERFRSLVQHASDVITVLNENGEIIYMSPSIGRVLGYKPEDLIGKTPFVFIKKENHKMVRGLFERVKQNRGPFDSFEFLVRHADGHDIYIEAVGSNLLHDTNVGGIVLNSRDITERKRAEVALYNAKEQAEEVARLKSNFLANMSHEIRTPLTGILGFASILSEEVVDDEQKEFVTLIEKSGNRLMETLNSVLDLARIEAGRMKLTLEPILVADSVNEMVRLLQPISSDKGIALLAKPIDPHLEMLVDVGAMNRILTNIIGNSLKFTNEGNVTVSVSADDANVSIQIADTGVGINEEFLPKLFNEFEQESTGIGRSHEGSGLGLTITRELVERMHGSISVESAKGRGTTFTVRFPRVVRVDNVVEPAAERSQREEAVTDSRSKRRVLVVDDNQNTRLLLSKMLKGMYKADAASNPEAAVAMVEEHHYDAILMDINLGAKISGEDVMGIVRQFSGYEQVPIVAFTAYALPGDRERFLNIGFDGYLSKPFTKAELLALLDDLISVNGDGASQSRDHDLHMIVQPRASVDQTETD